MEQIKPLGVEGENLIKEFKEMTDEDIENTSIEKKKEFFEFYKTHINNYLTIVGDEMLITERLKNKLSDCEIVPENFKRIIENKSEAIEWSKTDLYKCLLLNKKVQFGVVNQGGRLN